MVRAVHFLELVENNNHIENYVNLIPFDMIWKYTKLYIVVLHGL